MYIATRTWRATYIGTYLHTQGFDNNNACRLQWSLSPRRRTFAAIVSDRRGGLHQHFIEEPFSAMTGDQSVQAGDCCVFVSKLSRYVTVNNPDIALSYCEIVLSFAGTSEVSTWKRFSARMALWTEQ
jgi:hypothetical protein